MIDSILGVTLPYWLLASVKAGLLLQALATLNNLRKYYSSPSNRWFTYLLWVVVAVCLLDGLGDIAAQKYVPDGLNSLFLVAMLMGFIAWGYRKIDNEQALMQGAHRWADNRAVQKMAQVARGTPVDKVRITSEIAPKEPKTRGVL